MSSYVFMKVLESAPWRYDRGIRLLSRGRIDGVYQHMAGLVAAPGVRILDLGCGTGGLTLACAERGAEVVGIDRNAGMLEVARAKRLPGGADGKVEWIELSALEIEDRFAEESFDAIVSCLMFSELAPEEQAYVLKTALSRLKPGGLLVLADEVLPDRLVPRFLHRLARLPIVVITYVLTQATTRPVERLAERVRKAGFTEIREERSGPGDFLVLSARKGHRGQ